MTQTDAAPGSGENGATGRKQTSAIHAPVYAAGIMVAGGLLFAGWGVTNAALEGNLPFSGEGKDAAVVEQTTEPREDGLVTLPDKDNDGVPDQYQEQETTDAGGSGDPNDPVSNTDPDTSGRGDEGPGSTGDVSEPGSQGPSETQTQQPQAETYIIQPGDTLSEISGQTGVPLGTLVEANDIQDPNLIYAGSALLIPQVG